MSRWAYGGGGTAMTCVTWSWPSGCLKMLMRCSEASAGLWGRAGTVLPRRTLSETSCLSEENASPVGRALYVNGWEAPEKQGPRETHGLLASFILVRGWAKIRRHLLLSSHLPCHLVCPPPGAQSPLLPKSNTQHRKLVSVSCWASIPRITPLSAGSRTHLAGSIQCRPQGPCCSSREDRAAFCL